MGIEFLLTGSHASSLQGEVRSTHDIDLPVVLEPAQVPALVAAFPPPRFDVSESAAVNAVRHRRTFNVLAATLAPALGTKSTSSCSRTPPLTAPGAPAGFRSRWEGGPSSSAPRKTRSCKKLRWIAELGGSEKHMLDAVGVYELQAERLDRSYLEHRACELGVHDLWRQLRERAEPFQPDLSSD